VERVAFPERERLCQIGGIQRLNRRELNIGDALILKVLLRDGRSCEKCEQTQ
jgi:hypothetical protein